jgi:hypothetical protein
MPLTVTGPVVLVETDSVPLAIRVVGVWAAEPLTPA